MSQVNSETYTQAASSWTCLCISMYKARCDEFRMGC